MLVKRNAEYYIDMKYDCGCWVRISFVERKDYAATEYDEFWVEDFEFCEAHRYIEEEKRWNELDKLTMKTFWYMLDNKPELDLENDEVVEVGKPLDFFLKTES